MHGLGFQCAEGQLSVGSPAEMVVGGLEEIQGMDSQLRLVTVEEVFEGSRNVDDVCERGWAGPRAVCLRDEKREHGREFGGSRVFSGESFLDTNDVAEDSKW